jgi:hypothetical protein
MTLTLPIMKRALHFHDVKATCGRRTVQQHHGIMHHCTVRGVHWNSWHWLCGRKSRCQLPLAFEQPYHMTVLRPL